MPQTAIIEQLRRDRRDLKLTISEVADLTGTPESTAKKVFSSSNPQNFTLTTLQPYVDLFDRMKSKIVSDQEDDVTPVGDMGHAELAVVLLRLYREKSEELDALRTDAELRDRRHARLNLVQSIIIACLVSFLLFWLVYDVLFLDRGWIRSMSGITGAAFRHIRALL